MLMLLLGLVLFLGTHSVRIFADGWRSRLIQRIGALPYKGMIALFSIAGFALIVMGFGEARLVPLVLWQPPIWTRHVAAMLMLVAFILLVAAYVPGTRIKARVGHPMVAGTKTWALAHLLANGTLAHLLLFGSFLVWSIALFAVSRRRDRVGGVSYRIGPVWRDILAIALGFVLWGFFAHWGHAWLIGVRPFA